MPTAELERAAYHEAGHAVVALAQGRAVLEMRIEESPTVWGMARYDDSPQPDELDFRSGAIRQVWTMAVHDYIEEIAIAMGGPIAESLFSFRPINELIKFDSERITEIFSWIASIGDQVPELAGVDPIRGRDPLSAIFTETAYRLSRLTAWQAVTALAETLLRRKHLDEGEIMEVLDDTYSAPSQRWLFPGKRPKRHPVLIDSDRMLATYRHLCAARLSRDNGYMEQGEPSRYLAIRSFDRYVARLRKRRIEKLEHLEWVKRLDRAAEEGRWLASAHTHVKSQRTQASHGKDHRVAAHSER